jgi:hypothetical protein
VKRVSEAAEECVQSDGNEFKQLTVNLYERRWRASVVILASKIVLIPAQQRHPRHVLCDCDGARKHRVNEKICEHEVDLCFHVDL